MGEMTDDFDAYVLGSYEEIEDSYDERKLKYLEWVWRTHFDKEMPAAEVNCRKFPELGTIDKDECLLEMAALKTSLGYGDDEIDFPVVKDVQFVNGIEAEALREDAERRMNVRGVLNHYRQVDVALTEAMRKNKELGEGRMSRIDMLRRQAERMLAKAERLDGVPEEDTFENGQVIKFKKQWAGHDAYIFAAIKAGDFWFTTAQANRFSAGRLTWKALTDLLDEDADTIEVLDMESAIPIKEYVVGVQKALEQDDTNTRPAGADQ